MDVCSYAFTGDLPKLELWVKSQPDLNAAKEAINTPGLVLLNEVPYGIAMLNTVAHAFITAPLPLPPRTPSSAQNSSRRPSTQATSSPPPAAPAALPHAFTTLQAAVGQDLDISDMVGTVQGTSQPSASPCFVGQLPVLVPAQASVISNVVKAPPLVYAAMEGLDFMIQRLLELNADVTMKSDCGITADLAAFLNHHYSSETLLCPPSSPLSEAVNFRAPFREAWEMEVTQRQRLCREFLQDTITLALGRLEALEEIRREAFFGLESREWSQMTSTAFPIAVTPAVAVAEVTGSLDLPSQPEPPRTAGLTEVPLDITPAPSPPLTPSAYPALTSPLPPQPPPFQRIVMVNVTCELHLPGAKAVHLVEVPVPGTSAKQLKKTFINHFGYGNRSNKLASTLTFCFYDTVTNPPPPPGKLPHHPPSQQKATSMNLWYLRGGSDKAASGGHRRLSRQHVAKVQQLQNEDFVSTADALLWRPTLRTLTERTVGLLLAHPNPMLIARLTYPTYYYPLDWLGEECPVQTSPPPSASVDEGEEGGSPKTAAVNDDPTGMWTPSHLLTGKLDQETQDELITRLYKFKKLADDPPLLPPTPPPRRLAQLTETAQRSIESVYYKAVELRDSKLADLATQYGPEPILHGAGKIGPEASAAMVQRLHDTAYDVRPSAGGGGGGQDIPTDAVKETTMVKKQRWVTAAEVRLFGAPVPPRKLGKAELQAANDRTFTLPLARRSELQKKLEAKYSVFGEAGRPKVRLSREVEIKLVNRLSAPKV